MSRAFLLSFLCLFPAFAQVDRANLGGTIFDPSGAAIPSAKIEVSQTATGVRRETRADSNGQYWLFGLPIGNYDIRVSQDGFKTAAFNDFALQTGQRRTLDVTLEVGSMATHVEVEASVTALEQTSAEISSAIAEKQIREIPINGRNWSALMALAPGAINSGDGTQNSIRFFGRSRDDNNWTFDGVDATGVKDPRQEGNLRLVMSMDSIAEFKVNSALYNAEMGSGAGAQVNVVSRGGTNDFHGGVFEYLRNNIFDARRPFDPSEIPPFRLNQFGGSAGGPIRKNSTFFFANYEGLRQRLGQAAVSGLVPSALLRQQVSSTSPALAPIVNGYPVGQAPTRDPLVNSYTGVFNQRWREDSGLIRIDHRLSDRTSILGRFNTVDGNFTDRRTVLLEYRESFFRPTNATVQVQHVFSPRVLSETRLGVNRSALTRPQVGIFPESFVVPGLTTTSTSTSILENATSYSLVESFSYLRGSHSLKFGGEVRRIHLNVGNQSEVTVRYSSMNNFIANRADRIEANGTLPTMGVRRTYWFGFAQDEYKVSSALTLSLGLRYEYYGVPNEVNGRGKVFDLVRCSGFCPAGTEWYFPIRNNWAPRAGMAWSPKALRGRTVFRAGGGIFYGAGQNDDVNAAIDSEAERFQLTSAEAPNLSYPIDRFLPLAQSRGLQPRSLERERRENTSYQWSFSVQQEMGAGFVGQAAYVGNRGLYLFTRRRQNLLDPVTKVRPLPNFSDIDEKANEGNTIFHGLQTSLNRQFAKGLLFQAQYMWSHSIDDNAGSGDGVERMITSCRACERGNADFDIRHTLTVNSIYDLPFGRGLSGAASKLLGGWSLAGVGTWRTGRPFTVILERSSAAVPDGNARSQRPNLVPGVSTEPPGGRVEGELWTSRAAFATPANNTWGNLGRNTETGPGLWQVDAAITKRTYLGERVNLDFRFEAFNVFNRSQFGNPESNLSSGNFGLIRSVANSGATGFGTSRQLQFMLRLNF